MSIGGFQYVSYELTNICIYQGINLLTMDLPLNVILAQSLTNWYAVNVVLERLCFRLSGMPGSASKSESSSPSRLSSLTAKV